MGSVVSRDHRASDALAAEVVHVPCPECKAATDEPCVNRQTGKTARTPCKSRITAACPLAGDHTPRPDGFSARREWAERMTRTHRQAQCDGCGGWLIWIPKET